jgi:hypothetical protein
MNLNFKKNLNTLVILYLLILPHTVYSILDRKDTFPYFMSLLAIATLLFVFQFKLIIRNIYKSEFLFVIILCLLSLLTSWIHGVLSPGMAIVAPIVAYLGYFFIRNKEVYFNLKIFDIVFICLYIYFYFIYYIELPDFFEREGFDEDEVVFDVSSSNAIAIALNITLYAYQIINYLLVQKRERSIVIISFINFVFIFIQQSRAGIVVSLILLFISFFEYFGSKINKYLFYIVLPIVAVTYSFYDYIANYLSIIGGLSGLETYKINERQLAVDDFFKGLNMDNFIFGYGNEKMFYEYTYTFNVFLDFWSKYSLIGLLIFIFILMRRLILWRIYYFPLYYFLPFLFYAFVESWFFPEYWDVIMYFIIFVKRESLTQMINPDRLAINTNQLNK